MRWARDGMVHCEHAACPITAQEKNQTDFVYCTRLISPCATAESVRVGCRLPALKKSESVAKKWRRVHLLLDFISEMGG